MAAQTATAVDWWAAALSTRPADRAGAEAGVRAAYRDARLAEPRVCVWFGSPLAATVAALLLTGRAETVRPVAPGGGGLFDQVAAELAEHGVDITAPPRRSVRQALRDAPWDRARRRSLTELGARGWSGHWSRTGGELWPRVTELTQRLRGAVTDALAGPDDPARPGGAGRSAIRLALLDALLGQHDAAWLAALDEAPELTALLRVAGTTGWWWPYEDVALLAERPHTLHQDEPGRLHCPDGPALAFPDGFALHAWRGMPVPPGFSRQLAESTPQRIREETNAELRRVMLEHYGYDRYLADSGARPVHRDETGVLWRIDLDRDEPVVTVEVVNSTPEPDGTHRVYWLRVPPRTRTAREGVAWTFGLAEEEYQPAAQT